MYFKSLHLQILLSCSRDSVDNTCNRLLAGNQTAKKESGKMLSLISFIAISQSRYDLRDKSKLFPYLVLLGLSNPLVCWWHFRTSSAHQAAGATERQAHEACSQLGKKKQVQVTGGLPFCHIVSYIRTWAGHCLGEVLLACELCDLRPEQSDGGVWFPLTSLRLNVLPVLRDCFQSHRQTTKWVGSGWCRC